MKRLWPLLAIFAPAVIVLVFGALLLDIQRHISRADRQDQRATALIDALELALSSLKDLEAAQRGFIITADNEFLAEYEQAGRRVANAMTGVRAVDLDGATLASLERLVRAKQAFADATIRARRSQGEAIAIAMVQTGRGRALMDTLRMVVASYTGEQRATRDDLRRTAQARARELRTLIVGGALVAAAAAIASALLYLRSTSSLTRHARELRRANLSLGEQTQTLQEQSAALAHSTAALQQSEERFRRLADNAPDIIYRFRIKPDPAFEYVSPAATAMIGVSPAEFYADPVHARRNVHPDDRELCRDVLEGRVPAGEVVTIRWRRGNDIVWTEHRITKLHDAAGAVVAIEGIGRDSSDVRRQEQELRASEARFRALVENSSDLIIMMDADQVVTYVSPNAKRVIGYDARELMGPAPFELLHPQDQGVVRMAIADAIARPGEIVTWDARMQNEAGTWNWYQAQARSLLHDPAVQGIIFNVRNITDSRRLEEQLRHAQKMDAVGRLAGGIAHDFNNVLTAISISTQFALEDMAAEHPARADIQEVARAAERAIALTRQLLAFSRNQPMQREPVRLDAIVADMQRMLLRVVGEGIELVTIADPDPGTVFADRGQMEQVVLNLVLNARDAVAATGGKVVIRTSKAEVDVERAAREAVGTGDFVVLTVTDDGTGIDPAIRPQIFDPFFTTKPKGQGTGLGLATVYGIVKQSGGYITVESKRGKGSTFSVYLPRVAPPAAEPKHAVCEPGPLAGRARILVVEDDEAVRNIATRVLRTHGYEVLAASDPAEALRVLEMHTVDLLLTDMLMPGMTGRQLAKHATDMRPELKVAYMSGYTEDETTIDADSERWALLDKPFAPEDLARFVADALRDPA